MGIREQLHDALDEQGFPRPTLLAEAMSRLDARQPTSFIGSSGLGLSRSIADCPTAFRAG